MGSRHRPCTGGRYEVVEKYVAPLRPLHSPTKRDRRDGTSGPDRRCCRSRRHDPFRFAHAASWAQSFGCGHCARGHVLAWKGRQSGLRAHRHHETTLLERQRIVRRERRTRQHVTRRRGDRAVQRRSQRFPKKPVHPRLREGDGILDSFKGRTPLKVLTRSAIPGSLVKRPSRGARNRSSNTVRQPNLNAATGSGRGFCSRLLHPSPYPPWRGFDSH